MTIKTDSYSHMRFWSGFVSLCCAAVLISLHWSGITCRTYAPSAVVELVKNPQEAYRAWERLGLHGRTLLLFDRYPHMRGLAFYRGKPQLSEWNLIEFSIFHNIVRKIYYVVPDKNWNEFIQRSDINLFRLYRTNGSDIGGYLFTMSGVPLIAVPFSGLPSFDEQVMVYADSRYADYDAVRNLLRRNNIVSDCTVVVAGEKL